MPSKTGYMVARCLMTVRHSHLRSYQAISDNLIYDLEPLVAYARSTRLPAQFFHSSSHLPHLAGQWIILSPHSIFLVQNVHRSYGSILALLPLGGKMLSTASYHNITSTSWRFGPLNFGGLAFMSTCG